MYYFDLWKNIDHISYRILGFTKKNCCEYYYARLLDTVLVRKREIKNFVGRESNRAPIHIDPLALSTMLYLMALPW